MKNRLLIAGFWLLSLTAAKAQDTVSSFTFNLEECIDYAFNNQYGVKNAELDVEMAESVVKETIGGGLPQVSGVMNFQDYRSEEHTSELQSRENLVCRLL